MYDMLPCFYSYHQHAIVVAKVFHSTLIELSQVGPLLPVGLQEAAEEYTDERCSCT